MNSLIATTAPTATTCYAAPLDIFDATHESSPIGWAVHGSRYSGGAEGRQDAYVALVRMLLAAGSSLHYPGEQTDAYFQRLLKDAASRVGEILRNGRPNDSAHQAAT